MLLIRYWNKKNILKSILDNRINSYSLFFIRYKEIIVISKNLKMMCCSTGARAAFKGGLRGSKVPSSTSLTYEGIFSENFFLVTVKRNKANQ